jgi:hypothetical protein
MAAREACWCTEVKLGGNAAADLRERFTDCLCPRCLALAAEREVREEVPRQSAKNPTEKPAR